MPDGSTWFIAIGVAAIVCAIIGTAVGDTKDRSKEGFFLGLLLGVIGIVIVAVMPPSTRVRDERDAELAAALSNATGTPMVTAEQRLDAMAEAIRRDPVLGYANDPASLQRLDQAVAVVLTENRTKADLLALQSLGAPPSPQANQASASGNKEMTRFVEQYMALAWLLFLGGGLLVTFLVFVFLGVVRETAPSRQWNNQGAVGEWTQL